MRRAWILLALLAACSGDVVDPCSDCGSRPARLEVASIRFITDGSTRHPVTGAPVVDSVRVRYVIRNAGDSTSLPTTATIGSGDVYVTDSVPALQGGDSIARTRVVPGPALYRYELNARGTQTASLTIGNGGVSKTTSDSVHLAIPIISVQATPPREPHIRINDPLQLTVTITNHSPIAAARNIQLRHCLWDYDVGCWAPNWTPFGTMPLPDLAPGESRTLNYTTSISSTAYEEGYWYYGLSVCVTAAAENSTYMPFSYRNSACGGGGQIEVWPDFEECAPPLLTASPVTVQTPNCGHYPLPPNPTLYETNAINGKLYFVFAVQMEAGKSYRVTGVPIDLRDLNGKRVTDLDGAADRVAVATSGRYYIVVYNSKGPLTVSAVDAS